jgi:hypothetical protein
MGFQRHHVYTSLLVCADKDQTVFSGTLDPVSSSQRSDYVSSPKYLTCLIMV